MNLFMEKMHPVDWVDRLTLDWSRSSKTSSRFLVEMISGIIAGGDPRPCSVARFLDEPCGLKHTFKRLCRQLASENIDYENLRDRIIQIGASHMSKDDVIAFDPGDICKKHSREIENLYKVHDGSEDSCNLGFEDFSVEAIQRSKDGSVFHIPLYQKLISAKCPEYISQNRQINDAIHAVYRCTRANGIFVFDRAHDRSRIYEKSLFLLPDIRWVVRVKENRTVVCNDSRFFDEETPIGVLDLANMLDLSITPKRAPVNRKTALVSVGWTTATVTAGKLSKKVSIIVAADRRNKKPVFLMSSIPVSSESEALQVWGYYLDRWAKEEGYRLTKQALGAEKIRVLRWPAIQNQAFLVWASYAYICWTYYRRPRALSDQSELVLKNFKGIDKIKFKYYRIQQTLAKMLKEEKNKLLNAA